MSERLRRVVAHLGLRPDDRDLEYLDLGSRRFDLVFAVRVGLFHREPQRARALVEPWLAPGGRVEAFYDSPSS
jgi:hypothetical protein